MAKKKEITITLEGLHLLCAMCHYGYFDVFYGKSVYFTDGFMGDRQYLFQALGNLGAATTRQIDESVLIAIVGNKIFNPEMNDFYTRFVNTFNELLNQKNSPYRKIMFISEDQLILRLKRKAEEKFNDEIGLFLKKYKDSKKNGQPDLYDQIDNKKRSDETQLSLFQ